VASWFIVLIGLATLYQYVFGADLGIDQLLYLDNTASVGTSSPGRMSGLSAAVFVMLGITLAWYGGKEVRGRRWAATVVVISFFLSYQALCWYLLGVQPVVGFVSQTKMALHTSLTFMMATVAIMCLPVFHDYSRRFFSNSTFGRLLRQTLPIIVAVPVALTWLLYRLSLGKILDLGMAESFDAIILALLLSVFFWAYTSWMERAEESARKVEALKGQFFFLAAHELRTPITEIKWGLDLVESELAKDGSTKTALTTLEEVHAVANGLAELVNDLLDTARIEQGTFKIVSVESDLKKCLTEIVGRLKIMSDEAGIELRLNLPDQGGVAITDCQRVSEVVGNLISNAIKYNHHGGFVEVALKDQIDRIEIAVGDNGVGLSTEDIAKLFQRFSRIEREETKSQSGTGLGLFIVKEIVGRLGGTVLATSPGRGQGSTFTVSLPKKPIV
jgi:signal transduction histidine kinase